MRISIDRMSAIANQTRFGLRTCLVLGLLLFCQGAIASSEQPKSDDGRISQFFYNLIKLSTWPTGSFSDDETADSTGKIEADSSNGSWPSIMNGVTGIWMGSYQQKGGWMMDFTLQIKAEGNRIYSGRVTNVIGGISTFIDCKGSKISLIQDSENLYSMRFSRGDSFSRDGTCEGEGRLELDGGNLRGKMAFNGPLGNGPLNLTKIDDLSGIWTGVFDRVGGWVMDLTLEIKADTNGAYTGRVVKASGGLEEYIDCQGAELTLTQISANQYSIRFSRGDSFSITGKCLGEGKLELDGGKLGGMMKFKGWLGGAGLAPLKFSRKSVQIPGTKQFTIGILGEDPVDRALSRLSGEIVHGRHIEVVHYTDWVSACNLSEETNQSDCSAELADIQMLYIAPSERQHVGPILARLKGRNIMTISNMERFVEWGGMIGLNKVNSEIEFQINIDAARAADIEFDLELASLGEIVREPARVAILPGSSVGQHPVLQGLTGFEKGFLLALESYPNFIATHTIDAERAKEHGLVMLKPELLEEEALWVAGHSNDFMKPNLKAISNLGKSLNVQFVLTHSILGSGHAIDGFRLFLIDIESNRIYQKNFQSPYWFNRNVLQDTRGATSEMLDMMIDENDKSAANAQP